MSHNIVKSMPDTLERDAIKPVDIDPSKFNSSCILPYGLKINHIESALNDFINFLSLINSQLYQNGLPRLESFLMPANFSSIVGEFMNMSIPKYCNTIVKNEYHNGHPDLIPADRFPDNSVQHSDEGIEVKGSRHSSGWQGHNPEPIWLMVFYFDSNTTNDIKKNIPPKEFCFKGIYAAKLEEDDWSFSGRSGTSRRTITASVKKSGVDKMKYNWIYENLD